MIKTFPSILLMSALLLACGPEDKKAKLERLKKEQSERAEQIRTLEAELGASGAIDTTLADAKVVGIATVGSAPFVGYVKVRGKVDSDKNVMLSAKASGTITDVSVNEGEWVSEGEVMARIDSEILKSNMTELQSGLDLATTMYERQKNLWDQNIGTEVQYLQAKNQKESLEQKMASLQEQLKLTRIIAPFSGVVDEVLIKKGEVIAPGMPAIRVVNPSEFKISAHLAENHIASIKPGANAVVEIPVLDFEITTKITSVSRVIDPVTRTFRVEMELPDSLSKDVKANMIVYANIENYRNPDAVVIPLNTVHFADEKASVFVVKDNRAEMREISSGTIYNNEVEVLDGLLPGDEIITAGNKTIVDGQPVQPDRSK